MPEILVRSDENENIDSDLLEMIVLSPSKSNSKRQGYRKRRVPPCRYDEYADLKDITTIRRKRAAPQIANQRIQCNQRVHKSSKDTIYEFKRFGNEIRKVAIESKRATDSTEAYGSTQSTRQENMDINVKSKNKLP